MNNEPQILNDDDTLMNNDDVRKIVIVGEYLINNPIILLGVSVCGVIMAGCIMLNNKTQEGD